MASYDPRPSALAVLCAGLFALDRRERPAPPEDPAPMSRAVLGRAAVAFAVLCVTVALTALRG
ncbi:hypothetical protein [Streptomyces sp. NPDC048636]|uniref:hypothetical protein n=1 Tax=Streptomyces sp. NPDC048636 TaxID=3155762 RepID=UPI00343249E0